MKKLISFKISQQENEESQLEIDDVEDDFPEEDQLVDELPTVTPADLTESLIDEENFIEDYEDIGPKLYDMTEEEQLEPDEEEPGVDIGVDTKEEFEEGLLEEGEEPKFEIEEPEDYPSFASVYDALNWAMNNNEVLRIHYITLSGIPLVRDIEPHGMYHTKTTNNLVVVVWDRDATPNLSSFPFVRTYIVDRIESAEYMPKGYKFTGEKFDKKFEFHKTKRKNRYII